MMNMCFGCKNESLGYCFVHKAENGTLTSIRERTEVCECFAPKGEVKESAEKQPKYMLGLSKFVLNAIAFGGTLLVLVGLLVNLVSGKLIGEHI